MDDKTLEELKKQAVVDNSKLEELMKGEITPQMQYQFFELLKESQMFMPVTFSASMFENIEDSKPGDVLKTTGREGFDINYLTDNLGRKAVPLFTSEEAIWKAGIQSSMYVVFMKDLAEMLKQSDRYSTIAINPFTDYDINMPIEAFFALFEEDPIVESLNAIIKILKEGSVELEEDCAFFVMSDKPFMKDEAVDGVFTPHIPFNASSKRDFHDEMKYLNVLLMPKTSKVLFIGDLVGEDNFDTFIAPESEFEFVKDIDEFTSVWQCRAQPFYDE